MQNNLKTGTHNDNVRSWRMHHGVKGKVERVRGVWTGAGFENSKPTEFSKPAPVQIPPTPSVFPTPYAIPDMKQT